MIVNSIRNFRKIKHLLIGLFLFSILFGFNSSAFAVDPIADAFLAQMEALQATNLTNLATLPKELITLDKTYTQLQDQYTRLGKMHDAINLTNKNLTDYLTGDTGIENYLNGSSDMNARLWSNDKWSDVLKASGGGNTQGFTQMQQHYSDMYPVVDKNKIGGDDIKDTDLIRAQYEQQKDISRAALADSAYSYNTINQHIQNIKSILSQISNKSTEKASMDTNARLLAEVSYIQLEMLKNQDMQTQLMATESQGQVNGVSDESKFAQWNPPQ